MELKTQLNNRLTYLENSIEQLVERVDELETQVVEMMEWVPDITDGMTHAAMTLGSMRITLDAHQKILNEWEALDDGESKMVWISKRDTPTI